MLLLTYRPLRPPILLLGFTGTMPLLLTGPGRLGSQKGKGSSTVESVRVVNERVVRSPTSPPQASEPSASAEPSMKYFAAVEGEPEATGMASTMPPLPEIAPVKARTSSDIFSETPPPEARPRLRPEIQADPRTVFKQRGTTPNRFVPQAAEAALKIADGPVTDLMVVPLLPSFRCSEQGVKALLGYLRSTQILTAKHQKAWPDSSMSIELLPDAFVHLAFFNEGGSPPGPPCIAEAHLWFGSKPVALPFGADRESCFRLELVGVRCAQVSDAFVARLNSILYLKAQVLAVPHDPKRLRKPTATMAAEPIPHFDVQER